MAAAPARPTRPHRCGACDCIGRLTLADPHPNDPRPILRLSWGQTGAALLCPSCQPEPQTLR